MPKTFGLSYLGKEPNFTFDSDMIKLLKKNGYFCIDSRHDGKIRVLIFREEKP